MSGRHRIQMRLDKEEALKASLDGQMAACMRLGVNDDFQRGYLCALQWIWELAGYRSTATSIAAEAMVKGLDFGR